MNRFAVIIPYFGVFKPSILLFLESCNRNPDIDWFIFTDCEIPDKVKIKSNIRWNKTTLEEIYFLAQKKLKKKLILTRAYKLCDLKPFYGIIFEDYLETYEYWGYGDVDVIYGQITKFLSTISYFDYDKINWMGHLCFIRNNSVCNNAVFTTVEGTKEAIDVLATEENVGFDERDYNLKCIENNMKIYTGKWAADIDVFYWRMRCVDKKTYHYLLGSKEIKYAPFNFSKQIFASIDGNICRVYLRRGRIYFEEFAYIHFRKEVPIKFENCSENTFFITREGFEEIKDGKAIFRDYKKIQSFIEKYNNQENYLQELFRFFYQYYRKITGKRGW